MRSDQEAYAGHPVVLPHLSERICRRLCPAPRRGRKPSFVLYWMRFALRTHDNPALDLAASWALQQGVPLLILSEVRADEAYASDRHGIFALEGIREAVHALRGAGFRAEVFAVRERHAPSPVALMAHDAGLVVTEEMPVRGADEQVNRVFGEADCEVITVDTSCVVPMNFSEQAPTRAYQFRDATRALREERLNQPWATLVNRPQRWDGEMLAGHLTDRELDDPAQVVRTMDLDHSVGPVFHTRGGSRAGYARWEHFAKHDLHKYARRRNDPLEEGVSRLSAYLHYGMVSPFRVARQAAQQGGEGARKFLDEMLVWRELAYHWCFTTECREGFAALPGWARDTLARHDSDSRHPLTWIELCEGRTGDALWDAAQRSLHIHGELHNNLRMTWGKAILGWSASAEQAVERTLALNHRYALDGRDPNSYGGVLWCYGLFDRPFEETEFFGRVRRRDTVTHEKRLPVKAYAERHCRAATPKAPSVAVVGGGVGGLVCARTLMDHGWAVEVFDKGQRPGGRCATYEKDGLRWDMGTARFQVRDHRVRPWTESLCGQGVLTRGPWRTHMVEGRTVGSDRQIEALWSAGGMASLTRALGDGVAVHHGQRVQSFQHTGSHWLLHFDNGSFVGGFDQVVVALPLEQARDLVGEHAKLSGEMKSEPQFCLLLRGRWERPLEVNAVRPSAASSIVWEAFHTPQEDGMAAGQACAWTVQAKTPWSASHVDDDRAMVAELLFEEATSLLSPWVRDLEMVRLHRWKYAQVHTPHVTEDMDRKLWKPGEVTSSGLTLCGDWVRGGCVQGAWLSGMEAAGALLREAHVAMPMVADPSANRSL